MAELITESVTLGETVEALLTPAPTLKPLSAVVASDTYRAERVESTAARSHALTGCHSYTGPGMPVRTRSRVVGLTGNYLVPADVSAITMVVWQCGSDPNKAPLLECDIERSSLVGALMKDWAADVIGYCFDHTIPGDVFSLPGEQYHVLYEFHLIGLEGALPIKNTVTTHGYARRPGQL